MKKVCNLILIDASGSMHNRVSDLKGGLLQLFSDIKKETELYQHTIICDFSNDFNILVNSVSDKDLTSDVVEKYKTRGSTSLFDAIKKSFELVPSGFDGVFVSIITDGEENSSVECDSIKAKQLISIAKDKKWGVTFMGCDEKALDIAKSIGIDNTLSFMNSSEGYSTANKSRSLARSYYYDSVKTSATLDEIDIKELFKDLKSKNENI